MWSAIASVTLEIGGWFLANFFAKPLIVFWDLKKRIYEEILYTANIGNIDEDKTNYMESKKSLRRLGAQIKAINATAPKLLRRLISAQEYDLTKAGNGLIGLSNCLSSNDGSRGAHRKSVQFGLKLPED